MVQYPQYDAITTKDKGGEPAATQKAEFQKISVKSAQREDILRDLQIVPSGNSKILQPWNKDKSILKRRLSQSKEKCQFYLFWYYFFWQGFTIAQNGLELII